MESFDSEASYLAELALRAGLPDGFRAATTRFHFTPAERPTGKPYGMNLSLLTVDPPARSFAGVFTRNRFPGAPVIVARERMRAPRLAGILINNKISNVCSPTGLGDVHTLTSAVAERLGGTASEYLSVSTGIIGWSLPVAHMVEVLPDLTQRLGRADALEVARAIMTTDSFPKVRSATVGGARIVGIAKGAGMVEPNLATMLVFLLTDADIDRDGLRTVLSKAVAQSFNRISIDSDQSTSDMVVAVSSQRHRVEPAAFEGALTGLCRSLAGDVVRNGEGTCHVIRVRLRGAPCEEDAAGLAKAVVNSPLVKTAVFGNDPNVGRIIGALGDYAGTFDVALDPTQVEV
ncbi:MAG: arginine biosynthesis protein ArgJ, partial [Spirochaetaceae bacterium]